MTKKHWIALIIAVVVTLAVGNFVYFWWLGKQKEEARMLLETTLPTPPPPPPTPSQPPLTPSPPTPSPIPAPQVVNVVQTVYPGKYDPAVVVVKVGVPVVIRMTTTQIEHLNRVSIMPWVERSDTVLPGKITEITFMPDRTGDFQIRNIGHGFAGTLKVVE